MALEFRKLNESEKEKIKMALELNGATCTGASYVKPSQTYYIGITPLTQAKPSIRKRLESALGTTNLVINGRVKV